ncbi:MAG: hypothetical protein S4CHLAM81_11630 [Chlamydiales bacterium]|nr:hypothetical protein [Chlamydiales bacterium]MCH9635939.1 hypothetical protein [Chlamydiales bacterium]MCH9703614.1 F-box protein [Chlamydiota bacterium]
MQPAHKLPRFEYHQQEATPAKVVYTHQELPDDVWHLIFDRLDLTALACMRTTSKRYLALVRGYFKCYSHVRKALLLRSWRHLQIPVFIPPYSLEQLWNSENGKKPLHPLVMGELKKIANLFVKTLQIEGPIEPRVISKATVWAESLLAAGQEFGLYSLIKNNCNSWTFSQSDSQVKLVTVFEDCMRYPKKASSISNWISYDGRRDAATKEWKEISSRVTSDFLRENHTSIACMRMVVTIDKLASSDRLTSEIVDFAKGRLCEEIMTKSNEFKAVALKNLGRALWKFDQKAARSLITSGLQSAFLLSPSATKSKLLKSYASCPALNITEINQIITSISHMPGLPSLKRLITLVDVLEISLSHQQKQSAKVLISEVDNIIAGGVDCEDMNWLQLKLANIRFELFDDYDGRHVRAIARTLPTQGLDHSQLVTEVLDIIQEVSGNVVYHLLHELDNAAVTRDILTELISCGESVMVGALASDLGCAGEDWLFQALFAVGDHEVVENAQIGGYKEPEKAALAVHKKKAKLPAAERAFKISAYTGNWSTAPAALKVLAKQPPTLEGALAKARYGQIFSAMGELDASGALADREGNSEELITLFNSLVQMLAPQ